MTAAIKFLNFTSGRSALAVLLLLPFLASCMTTNPATGEQDVTPFMSPAEEARIGAEEHPKMLARFGGVHDDPEIGAYVASVGGRLAAHSERADLEFTFTVLNSKVVNAFALPGGYVYISRGLLALANSEAELASVLAHEIGHVTARHSAQRHNRSIFMSLGAAVLGAAVGNEALNQIASLGGQLYLTSFSREQEHQADNLGIRYMKATGYDARAAADFLRTLGADDNLKQQIAGAKGQDALAGFFATHPKTQDRVQRAADAAADGDPRAARLVSRYFETIDGIIYGDDPDQGLIRDRMFWHAKQGFTFEVPEGFKLVNTEKAVLAFAKNGARIRFDSEPGKWSGSMSAYITNKWARKLQRRELQAIEINGMPAATAIARVAAKNGPADLRLIALRFVDGVIYRFVFLTPPRLTAALDLEFRRMAFRFRAIGPDEADRIKPTRVHIFTVREGDGAAGLAGHMAVPDYAEARFRVLNGLRPGEKLKPGRSVKIITE